MRSNLWKTGFNSPVCSGPSSPPQNPTEWEVLENISMQVGLCSEEGAPVGANAGGRSRKEQWESRSRALLSSDPGRKPKLSAACFNTKCVKIQPCLAPGDGKALERAWRQGEKNCGGL